MTYEQIIADFTNYVCARNGTYSHWYVGITNNVERRMFGEHSVNKDNDFWIFRHANSSVARRVEQYFINSGMSGGSGGGDYTAHIVYAYRISTNTNP